MNKTFVNFNTGIVSLVTLSYSARQAVEAGLKARYEPEAYYQKELEEWLWAIPEYELAVSLAYNGLFRPTGNGVGWNGPEVNINSFGVRYRTSGGLVFGWVKLPDYMTGDCVYKMFVKHFNPRSEVSTLRSAFLSAGWEPEDGEPPVGVVLRSRSQDGHVMDYFFSSRETAEEALGVSVRNGGVLAPDCQYAFFVPENEREPDVLRAYLEQRGDFSGHAVVKA